MQETVLLAIAAIMLGVSVVSLVCRVSKMGKETKETVFWQHVTIGIGDFGALVVVSATLLGLKEASLELAIAMCAGGHAAYLLFSAARWWYSPPPDTVKNRYRYGPERLDPSQMSKVSGGKR
jgi:hypothetical protein